ncbi:hypothetical protein WA158_006043 [Blastocystis sp. Blastoise]
MFDFKFDWNNSPYFKQEGVESSPIPYFKYTVLGFLIIQIIETILDFLERRVFFEKSPSEDVLNLARSIDAENNVTKDSEDSLEGKILNSFEKNQVYNREKSGFGLIHSVYSFIQDLFLLFIGSDVYFWELCKKITVKFGLPENEYIYSFLLTLIITILSSITSFPWGYYEVFHIEQKYGFNRSTRYTFVTDILKNILVEVIISGVMNSGIIYIVQHFGSSFYIYTWIAFVSFSLFINLIYPVVIMPLFNKLSPLEPGALRSSLESLCSETHYNCKKMYIMDGSKRSSKGNAMAYGLCGNNGIILYDTIVEKMSIREMTAVLSHELGHWKYCHIYISLFTNSLNFFVILYLFSFFIHNQDFYHSFGFSETPVVIGFNLFLSCIWLVLNHLTSFFENFMSRAMEFAADRFACKKGYGVELKRGLYKLHIDNGSCLKPNKLVSLLRYDHPTLIERCDSIDEYLKKHE